MPEEFSLPTLTPTHLGCWIVDVRTYVWLLCRVGLVINGIWFINWTKW